MHEPRLSRFTRAGCTYWTDDALMSRTEIVVAFSERTGGVSSMGFATLNLAAHVGDVARDVDENRSRFLASVGLAPLRDKLVTAEQVHGTRVALVDGFDGGRGAWAEGGAEPVAGTDGLVTSARRLPLMMLFADCVPIVLVALGSSASAVGVFHGGWRGIRDQIAHVGVRAVCQAAECDPCNVLAYIGPHICAKDFEVGPEVVSQFDNIFATLSRAGTDAIDLGAAVSSGLVEAGVPMSAQCSLDACTFEHTDRFFSHRAGGQSGRHAALAALAGREG